MTALPSETFNKAVALIEEHGWCQGNMRGPKGEFCADGALWWASIPQGRECADFPTYDAARMMSRRLLRMRGLHRGVVTYNDHPGRTKEEVLEVLRWMAQQARAEGL